MRQFSDFNPIVIAVWFFAVTGICMFCNYPALMGISLLGGVLLFLTRNGFSHGKTHMFFAAMFVILALANPLISHNGVTVLLVVNHNPVTLEALLYGLNSAAMIVGVLYWFRSFTQIMTSEKLLYLTGSLSPKLSLVLSMALRFVPLLTEQSRKIHDAQIAAGLYRKDNAVDGLRGRMREFSVLITWALENGITTADSMESRGYGVTHRSRMKLFRWTRPDVIFLLVTLALTSITALSAGTGALQFAFYPAITAGNPGIMGFCGMTAFALLVLMPTVWEWEVRLYWHCLTSKL